MLQIFGTIPYFRDVNSKKTIQQQLLAVCLLTVFLFITMIKLVHSHESLSFSKFSSYLEQGEKSTDCSICDFHLAKDAEIPNLGFVPEKTEISNDSPVFYQNRKTSSIGLNYSDRGPPSRA